MHEKHHGGKSGLDDDTRSGDSRPTTSSPIFGISSNGEDSKDKDRTTDRRSSSSSPVDVEVEATAAAAAATPHPVDVPPNGGYGWVCTVCVAFINAHTWGINSSYGVFLAHYLTNDVYPGATYLQYAFVGSLSVSGALLLSPVATITTREYGTRVTLLVGTFFEVLALLSASWASRIWHLFLSQGLCFGVGMGFLFVGSVGIVPQWFTTRRSLANGIATAGSGFGGLVYSLATGAMIRTIGLSWAFRVLGLLALIVNVVCALVLRDRNKEVGSSQLAFDVSLFKRVEYLLLLAFGWFSMLAYVTLLFSIANYANSVGLSASQASTVSAILNLGQGLGRPPIGYFSDAIGRLNMATAMTFLAGLLSLVVWIFAKIFPVLIFYALVGGAVAGTIWTTIAPVTVEVVGLKHVPSALSMFWLVLVVPSTFSEPIGLEIVNFDGGNYLGAQVYVGVMYIAASACTLLIRGWKIGEIAALEDVKGASVGAMKADEMDAGTVRQAEEMGRRSMWVDCWEWKKV